MPESTASPARTAEVLVVGAGPTGLLLAGDLAEAGIEVTVLERRDEESNLTRAFGVHARTLEQLDARALADDLVATGITVSRARLFGDLPVDLSSLPTRFPFILITPQYHTEQLLERRALAAGARIVRGAEVTGLRQDDSGVELDICGTGDAAPATYRARYAVGADGVHSAVRRLLGLPFPGGSVISSVLLADVRLARDPARTLTVGATGRGFGLLLPFGDGWYRVIAWDGDQQLPDDAPVDVDDVRSAMRHTLGDDYGLHDPRWLSRFHSDERQVPHYRQGRVFLAGDAAHCHSPAGGLGMNTGLQDAANLSWKLAAVLRDHAGDELAGDELLNSYHAERHPVGRAALHTSGALVRVALARSVPARALRAALAATAKRIPALPRRGARAVSGIAIAYPAPRGAHRLTGRRVPDLRLAQRRADAPRRLYEALRGGRFVLVGHHPQAVRPWGGRVLAAEPAGDLRSTVLVRPDGYAAWAADNPSPGQLHTALTTWAGAPSPVGSAAR